MIAGKVVLKKGKEISIQRKHPWLFSGAIQNLEGSVVDGGTVAVVDARDKVLGYGHYQNGSIAVRMISFDPEPPNENFWVTKFTNALHVRNAAALPNDNTNAYRLIHGEGDDLPGLIIDMYDGVAVVQAHSAGMHNDRKEISAALEKVFAADLKAVYYKSQGTLPGKMRDEAAEEYLFGMAPAPHIVSEYGRKFYIDWEAGQKTGFFLDQRENRKLLGTFSRGKAVLNTFCYTGGFSIYALHDGAAVVHSVDSSAKAIALTEKNIELNGFDAQQHACFAQDTFDFLKNKENIYDVIVLDPPAFAKHRDARHQAVRGYQRLNSEAMQKIKKGGILFTFSCSQVVDRQLFYDTITAAAIQAQRSIKVLHHLSQPADHPVSIFHPEGEYLKGLVLYVE
jgi:23S rRNA (cytosine1962-C5)-methyltransferase